MNLALPEEDCIDIRLLTAGGRRLHDGKHLMQFAFQILLENISDSSIRLKGRKWIITGSKDQTTILDGENVFNIQPLLKPREVFSYTGYHLLEDQPRCIELRYFGLNGSAMPFITPSFSFPRRAFTIPGN